MAAKWEKLEGNVGVLTIEVDAKEVNNSIDAAFKKVVKTINVPGFRKGKMPRPLFEQRFGVESLYQDALDIILPKAYGEAIDEAGIFQLLILKSTSRSSKKMLTLSSLQKLQ